MQVRKGMDRIRDSEKRLLMLAQGGTAVGTGINTDPRFAVRFAQRLKTATKRAFVPNVSFFESLGAQDAAVEMSGQLRTLAVSLLKVANDLRWMNSGPLAGLGEIELPALQPGSSIMPGKVNPVVPEAVAMVSARVIGNDAGITIAGQSGNFQLNVMLPLIADNLLESISLLAAVAPLLANAIAGFKVRDEVLRLSLAQKSDFGDGFESGYRVSGGGEDCKNGLMRSGGRCWMWRWRRRGWGVGELRRLLNPEGLTDGGVGKS